MAATKLTYAQTGVMLENTYPDLTGYDASIYTLLEREARTPLQGGRFFNKETAKSLTHKLSTWSTILNNPRKSSDTDALPVEQAAPGYDWSVEVDTYRNAVVITRTMQKLDQSGMCSGMQGGLLQSGRKFLEMKFADVINSGAATAGSDGSYLFATDHYHEDASAGTWSNAETAAALTTTTFNTMRRNMRKRKDEKGLIQPITLKELVGPADLEEKGRQITGSDKVAESALNAINPWKGVNFSVWDYLTSTTAFYGIGDLPDTMSGLHYVVFTEPSIVKLPYPNAQYPDVVAGWRIYMQVACSGSQLKNMHRNAGA